MTQATFARGMYLPAPPTVLSSEIGSTSLTIDANNEIAAFIVRAPKAGDVRSVSWMMGSVGVGGTITVGLYQVDATTGNPADTPTALAANTFITKAIVAGDANDLVNSGNFTADATVTKGQLFAVCFINPGASPGTMNISTFADSQAGFPYNSLFTGTWAKGSTVPNVILHYSDGTAAIPGGCYGIGDVTGAGLTGTTYTLSTSTTPDVMGARINLPAPVQVTGAWILCDADGNFNVKLVTAAWDGASSGLLASADVDLDVRADANIRLIFIEFDAAVDLSANTNYRMIVEPTSTTSMSTRGYSCATQAQFEAQPGSGGFHVTTAKDPNDDTDWTNYNNGSDGYRVPYMGLIIDGLDDGAGGGSTKFPAASMLNGVIQR